MKTFPNAATMNGFDYAAVSRPAAELSDGFADCSSICQEEVALAIGTSDYSDEPFPSLFSSIRQYLRTRLALRKGTPATVADDMNDIVYECWSGKCFLTCFCATYNTETRALKYVNAGHEAPLLVRSNPDNFVRLEKGGPVFGLRRSPRYNEGQITLKPGDRFVAFTPTVIDSIYGTNHVNAEAILVGLIRTNRYHRAADLAEIVLSEAEENSSDRLSDYSVLTACLDKISPPLSASVSQLRQERMCSVW